MASSGYYRFPTIHRDTIAFTSEEDLWCVPAAGGEARRLTSGLGSALHPSYSPDGTLLAFSGREEGPFEVYVMPAQGGQPRRITFLGATVCNIVGWTMNGRIVFASTWGQPFNGMISLYSVAADGSDGSNPQLLPTGPASYASFGPAGETVIQRPSVDAAHWKRYRGGTAGDLWIDATNSGAWKRLTKLEGNPSRPMWIGRRIYFLSDHEGVGNLYSCTTSGTELTQHTKHADYYARHASSDGRRIVYHAGADVYLLEPESGKSQRVDIHYHSPRTQRNRKFIDAGKWLETYAPHPQGHMLALGTRGKIVTLGHFDGPVRQHGEPNAGRYRLACWLSDGKRLVAVSDAEGRESITVHDTESLDPPQRLDGIDVARVVAMKASPRGDSVVITNVRNEIILVDLAAKTTRIIDRSEHTFVNGFDVSPDGKWIAYSWASSLHTSIIRLFSVDAGTITEVTRPVLMDMQPAFDPEGKYLYFLSRREFDPVYDGLHFDLGFPKGIRPYLVTLRKNLTTPFALAPKAAEEPKKDGETKDDDESKKDVLTVDLDGIQDRVVAFPVPEGIYQQIDGIKGKALFTSVPIAGSLKNSWVPGAEQPAKATLEMFDFATLKAEPVVGGITDFTLSLDRKTLVYRAGNKLRVLKAGEKSDDAASKEPPGRKSGWIDLKRVRVNVEPTLEWRQMYGEAWRLQREQFWVEDMAEVDWQGVYDRYSPLLDRVSTRAEFTDLLWEMQGELGSSHAYAIGGDLRAEPTYDVGLLGADIAWDDSAGAWKVKRLANGDVWDEESGPPLRKPGLNVVEGETTILAVNGRRAPRETSPAQLLVNQGAAEVALTLGDAAGKNPRVVSVKTIKSELLLRYREWVEKNRAWVHEQTGGKCGYVHVPNMGPWGYAEFHRGFLLEVDRPGLLVDVRFNGGGHVSALLLEKLARRPLAYCQSRWFGVMPWPDDSPAGPMVALTNEFAGSDGDIFSQNFKAMKLGPLIGKRTWGGVIGIWPRHALVDGGVTTQPEFSFWFRDVGWNVENYGVDPDIEVEFPPQDHARGTDPQLARGVQELMKLVEKHPRVPQFGPRPSRAWPSPGAAATSAKSAR